MTTERDLWAALGTVHCPRCGRTPVALFLVYTPRGKARMVRYWCYGGAPSSVFDVVPHEWMEAVSDGRAGNDF